jgi:hypothetical protein
MKVNRSYRRGMTHEKSISYGIGGRGASSDVPPFQIVTASSTSSSFASSSSCGIALVIKESGIMA